MNNELIVFIFGENMMYLIPCLFAGMVSVYYLQPYIDENMKVIKKKYNKLIKLKQLYKKKEKDVSLYKKVYNFFYTFVLIYKIIFIMIQALIYNYIQKLNKNVVKENDYYVLTYYIKGNKFMMRVKSSDITPSPFFLITGDNDEDLTEIVEPYRGPMNDFYNNGSGNMSPKSFGQEKLHFENIDGTSKTFYNDESILLKQA